LLKKQAFWQPGKKFTGLLLLGMALNKLSRWKLKYTKFGGELQDADVWMCGCENVQMCG
jgi:hypothetical protein